MKTFQQFIEDNYDVKFPKGNIPSSWFKENYFPMIVLCTCCGMTMASPSALIDDDGYTYCADCADVIS